MSRRPCIFDHRGLLSVAVALAVTRACGCGSRLSSEGLAYWCRAEDAKEAKDYERAVRDYTKVLALCPSDADTYCRRGEAYFRKGDCAEAAEDYSRAIELGLRGPKVYYSRGIAREDNRDYEGAEADFTKVLELRPNSAAAHLRRAIVREETGRLSEAIADYDKALELEPDNVAARHRRAFALRRAGDYEGAIADFTQVISANLKRASTHFGRGLTYELKGDLEEATTDYTRAVAVDPRHVGAFYRRGIVLALRGKLDLAARSLTRAIELRPDFVGAYYRRAHVFRELGGHLDRAWADQDDVERLERLAAIETFTFDKDELAIFLPVRLGGRELLLDLDTGCPSCIFDSSLRSEMGSVVGKREENTPGGPIELESFEPPAAFLGKLDLRKGGPADCFDFSELNQLVDRKISGTVGMSFLQHYVIQIDFDSGTVTFRKSDDLDHPEWGEALAMLVGRGGLPFLRARILDVDAVFVIDMGDSGTGGLQKELFDKLVEREHAPTVEYVARTFGGDVRDLEARFGDFSLGSLTYKDLIFRRSVWSVIGLDFLSRHKVTFDFPRRKLYLAKGREFGKSDEANMSGLCTIRRSGQTIVKYVLEDTPAWEADMRPGDVLLEINGKKAQDLKLGEIWKLLRAGDDVEVELTYRRGDKVHEARFRLKRRL